MILLLTLKMFADVTCNYWLTYSEAYLALYQIFMMKLSRKIVHPFSASPTKWSNTPNNCLTVLDQFVGLALKRLTAFIR